MIRPADTDKLLIISFVFLVAMGIAMVYSTSYIYAASRFGDGYLFFRKHVVYAVIGLGCFIAGAKIPYGTYRKLAYPALIVAFIMLIAVLIPGVGYVAGGARRWLRLGPVAFQPSEAAKMALVFFMAANLAKKQERIKEFWAGFMPNMLIPGVVISLIMLEPDLGTAACAALIVLIMNFISGVRIRYLAVAALGAASVVYFFVIRNFGYMMTRIMVYLDPWKDPEGKGFQMVQSFIAFGSGGIHGVGIGESKQKLFYLPEAHTDFIFSVIGEETGLIGAGLVIMFYALFLYSGTRIALKSVDLHGKFLAIGVTFMIVMQAAINMAVVLGLLPPKGLPLPFISYGGTSLVVSMFAAGILLNINMRNNEA